MKKGVILVAHGSKRPEANAVFKQVVTEIKDKIDYDLVKGAVMEFAEPKLSAVVEEFIERGIEQVIIVPLFLFPGTHVKKYLPKMIKKLKEDYSQVEFKVGDSIGEEKKFVELVADKVGCIAGSGK